MMKLFEEFDSINYEKWLKKATADLKGIDPRDKYKKDLSPKITQFPYYEKTSIEDHFTPSIAHLIPTREFEAWFTTEKVYVINEKGSNSLAIKSLESGCNGIIFVSQKEDIDLAKLLDGISLAYCYIGFEGFNEESVKNFLNNYTKSKESGSFNISFIGNLKAPGSISKISPDSNLATYRDISLVLSDRNTETIPSSIAQLMSLFVDIVSATDEGNIQNLFNRIVLTNQCIDHYFYEISKIRAIRILFNEMAAYYSLESPHIFIQSETTTSPDELDNLLTNSTQAMSAVIGSTDALIVTPHQNTSTEFSNRVARNVSNLLWEESRLDKVKDPVAGSYYLTSLTEMIVEESWGKFIEIETLGGYTKRNERIA